MSNRTIMLASLYWHSPQRLPIALVILAAAGAVTLWLYPPQLRQLDSDTSARGLKARRWLMPGLRIGALAALTISLLQPVVLRSKTTAERGAVVVLLDDSRSMSVADTGRTPAQLIDLAAALGRLPRAQPGSSISAALLLDAERLSSLSEAIGRQRSELDYARLAGRGVNAAKTRLDDTVEEFRDVVRAAAVTAERLPSGSSLQHSLADLTSPAPGGGNRDTWLEAVRARVPGVLGEIEQARRTADEQLFRADPAVRETCADLGEQSRFDLAISAIDGEGGVSNRLGSDIHLLGFTISDRIAPFAIRAERQGESPPPPPPLVADGTLSNLTGAVRAALDYLQGTPVRAVVLFSDGRQVGGDATVTSGLAAGGVPVYAVQVAPRDALKDLSIARMSAPSSAFVGETLNVRAEVRAVGFDQAAGAAGAAGAAADVTFSVDRADDLASSQPASSSSPTHTQTRHVMLSGDTPAAVEFACQISEPGATRLRVTVGGIQGEATDQNNHADRWLKAIRQRIRVAAYSGSAAWDFQFIRNALARSAWADLSDGILADASSKLPLSPEEILARDVLLLYDVPASALAADQWAAVNRLVSERGGSVVFIAGDSNCPGGYSAATLGSAINLLPFAADSISSPTPWRTWPGEWPAVHILPSSIGTRLDALRLSDDPEPIDRRWQQLPGMFRFLPITPLKTNTHPLLAESESGLPVLTESRIGAGRAFLVGFNESWRWRWNLGERDQDRFWLQLLRYAAEEPYETALRGVSLDADAITASPGEPVHVRARVLDEHGLPAANAASTELRIMRGDQEVRVLPMTADTPFRGRFSVNLLDLEPGDYRLQFDAGDMFAKPSIPLMVHRSVEAEMADVSVEDDVLRRLARASGGDFFRLDQLDALTQKLTDVRNDDPSSLVERSLWDSPYLYGLVVGCLAIEWATRKRMGLP
jgi:hypothetical protein